MDLATFRLLLTPEGQDAVTRATQLAPAEAGLLAAVSALRKRYPPALATAAVETVLLRSKARDKFARAEQMYFTREALEQASARAVAEYRAARLVDYGSVLDLCCGIGADTITLAAAGCRVSAHDADELRVEMARANVAARGLSDRASVAVTDVTATTVGDEGAAFVDPGRRDGDRRFLDPKRYQPPLGAVLGALPPGFPLAAKVAPGIARSDLAAWDADAEFVSVDGELKECVLWFGPLRSAAGMRATVLPGPHTMTREKLLAASPPSAPREFVFDPDPAVVRADLVDVLADQLDAAPVDHGVAFLTGQAPRSTPFAACYRVEHAAALHVGRLRDYCREHGIGRLTVLKRAVDLDVNEVTRKLKLDGAEHRTLILSRVTGRPFAILAAPAQAGAAASTARSAVEQAGGLNGA